MFPYIKKKLPYPVDFLDSTSSSRLPNNYWRMGISRGQQGRQLFLCHITLLTGKKNCAMAGGQMARLRSIIREFHHHGVL
jgi:hypothetical protein